jgi:hypothetical protein
VKTLEAIASGQQKNPIYGLGESFMHERSSLRINLAPARSAEWFLHSLGRQHTHRPSYRPEIFSQVLGPILGARHLIGEAITIVRNASACRDLPEREQPVGQRLRPYAG